MITFILGVVLLVLGYLIYGKIVDRHFGPDPSKVTPAVELEDNIDFKPLPTWKVYVVQFLNIAGLGPIFGAILGAAYGPAAFLWIVFGCIFAGGVHDYFSGMLSMRHGGKNLPDITGGYLGRPAKILLTVVIFFLLLSVGVSFVTGPADLLSALTGMGKTTWLYIIFGYYFLATILPVDKIIGSIYPFFGMILLFMALSVGGSMIVGHIGGSITMPELTAETLKNFHSDPDNNILIPMLFIVLSCGALSGFHSTQSPIMARCLTNEKHGRAIFYGAMITEGVVAMIWAAAAMSYFGGPEGLNKAATEGIMINGVLTKVTPAIAVNTICQSWLGKVGAIIAVLGVVICPITSGDTAFRSLRLNIADAFNMEQKSILKRFVIAIPVLFVAWFCCQMDFQTIWKFFGIANQTMASLVLWGSTAYLIKNHKSHLITSIPATFMSFICVSYFMVAPVKNGGLHLPPTAGYICGAIVAVTILTIALVYEKRFRKGIARH